MRVQLGYSEEEEEVEAEEEGGKMFKEENRTG